MSRRIALCTAWYAVAASALSSSPWFDLAPPSAPERVSTLAEVRPKPESVGEYMYTTGLLILYTLDRRVLAPSHVDFGGTHFSTVASYLMGVSASSS